MQLINQMLSYFFGGGSSTSTAGHAAKKAKKRKPKKKKASEPLNLDFDEEDDSDDDDGRGGVGLVAPVIVTLAAVDDDAVMANLGDPVAATVEAILRRAAVTGAAPFTRTEVEACVRLLWDDGKAYDDPEVSIAALLPLFGRC